jgi:hypothetical protein
MRRVPLWLTGLIPVLALAACGTGGGHPAGTASPAGQTGRGGAGRAAGVSPGWRIVQALPSEPGSGQPGGGSNDMLSVAAVGARDAWAVGYVCPQQCGPSSDSTLVEHWAGARHQPGRPRRHLDVRGRARDPGRRPPLYLPLPLLPRPVVTAARPGTGWPGHRDGRVVLAPGCKFGVGRGRHGESGGVAALLPLTDRPLAGCLGSSRSRCARSGNGPRPLRVCGGSPTAASASAGAGKRQRPRHTSSRPGRGRG